MGVNGGKWRPREAMLESTFSSASRWCCRWKLSTSSRPRSASPVMSCRVVLPPHIHSFVRDDATRHMSQDGAWGTAVRSPGSRNGTEGHLSPPGASGPSLCRC